MSEVSQKQKKLPLIERPRFMYLYLLSLLMFILVSGYLLFFAGSLMFEGIVNGWYRPEATDSDNYALWVSYLTVFACLFGLVGGIVVLATGTERFHNVKILMFVPAVVWTVQLILVNFRWGLTYWTQLLYLVPSMLVSGFVLYCVIKQVRIPILPKNAKKRAAVSEATPEVSLSNNTGV